MVVIGATCRSPPSCGARRQHATPRPVVPRAISGTLAQTFDASESVLGSGAKGVAIGNIKRTREAGDQRIGGIIDERRGHGR